MGRLFTFCTAVLTLFIASAVLADEPASAGKPVKEKASLPAVDISVGILAGETPADVRIEKALDEPTALDNVHELPLTDLIDYLRKMHKIEIQLDAKAMEEAGVAPDTPITRNLQNISLRSALAIVLRALDLTYVIRDEVLLITTTAQAETIMQTRIYSVADLIDQDNLEVIDRHPVEGLMETITGTIAPTTWNEVGGAGSIKFLSNANSLVVSETYNVHEELRNFLVALRKTRALERMQAKDHAVDRDPEKMFVAIYPLSSMAIVHHARAIPAPDSKGDNTDPAAAKEKPASKPSSTLAVSNRGLADDIARAIPKLIEPTSWQTQGGQGSIESVGIGVAVRQTRQVHREISRLLRSIDTHVPGGMNLPSGGGGMF
jgi:hypothetical protein